MAFTSQLGTVNSQLGQMVLGFEDAGDPLVQSVSHTLVLTQAIELNAKVVSSTSTLILTQTIGLVKVFSRSVTSTLALTQRITPVKFLNVSSILTFAQGIVSEKAKVVSSTSTLNLSQSIGLAKSYRRLVISGVNLTQIVARNVNYARSVSSAQTLLQTVIGNRVRYVQSTLNLTHTISFVKLKHVRHTLNLAQNVALLKITTRSYNQPLELFQTINRTTVLHPTVLQTLTFSQSVIGFAVRGVTHALVLSQSVIGYATKSVINVLNFNQNIRVNHVANVAASNTLNLRQDIQLVRSKSLSVGHVIAWNQTVGKKKILFQSVNHLLNLSQLIKFSTYVRSVTQPLVLTQTIAYKPVHVRSVVSSLGLSQSVANNATYNRSVNSVLVFPTTRSIYVGLGDLENIVLDNIQYSLVRSDAVDNDFNIVVNADGQFQYTRRRRPYPRRYCVLSSPNDAVTLPSPEFNDSVSGTGDLAIKKSMNNVSYTYVRRLKLKVLKMTFILDKAKAWELRNFLIANSGLNSHKLIDLYTWKGDKWKVFVKTNPLELNVTGKYTPADERVNINLEFEGFKVI